MLTFVQCSAYFVQIVHHMKQMKCLYPDQTTNQPKASFQMQHFHWKHFKIITKTSEELQKRTRMQRAPNVLYLPKGLMMTNFVREQRNTEVVSTSLLYLALLFL